MSAKKILEAVRTLTSAEEMRDKIASYQETIRALIERVEQLAQQNNLQKERLEQLFKKMQCPDCVHYLESKAPGDTIECHECKKVFLARCWGIQ